MCDKNDIDRDKIKVHLLFKDEVNAFALPDGHLVIFSGLILESENPEELSGVIAHELAHIKLNHVMTKLMREVGLSVLLSMASGGGGDMLRETAKMLSSTAFDRALEKEADIKAVDYLIEANISPEPFATFLLPLSQWRSYPSKIPVSTSTDPNS
ncbi:MAG: M48 family metallopeptidase [Cyclobacteriaceae bacterium]|nr:M48 family metallopeptidase [Cyclobacteriaceae bacterium]